MYCESEILNYPVTSGSSLAPYLRVNYNGTTVAAAAAEEVDIGTLAKRVQTNETMAAVMPRINDGIVYMVAAGAVAVGNRVYGAASGKVSTTANCNMIGIARTACSADNGIIEVQRISGATAVFSQVAASTAVTNTTTETDLDNSLKAINPSVLKAGDSIRVRAQAIATATNSTDTLAVKLYLGAQAIVTTGAVDVANNDIAFIDAIITVRVAGASGKIVATGVVALGVEGTVTAKPFKLAETSIDLSGSTLNLKLTATWSVANSGNSMRSDVMLAELVRA